MKRTSFRSRCEVAFLPLPSKGKREKKEIRILTKSRYLRYLFMHCRVHYQWESVRRILRNIIRQTRKYVKKKERIKDRFWKCMRKDCILLKKTQMEIYILRLLRSLYNKNENLNAIKSNDDGSTYKYVR